MTGEEFDRTAQMITDGVLGPVGWLVHSAVGWQLQQDGRVVQLEVVEEAVLVREEPVPEPA